MGTFEGFDAGECICSSSLCFDTSMTVCLSECNNQECGFSNCKCLHPDCEECLDGVCTSCPGDKEPPGCLYLGIFDTQEEWDEYNDE